MSEGREPVITKTSLGMFLVGLGVFAAGFAMWAAVALVGNGTVHFHCQGSDGVYVGPDGRAVVVGYDTNCVRQVDEP